MTVSTLGHSLRSSTSRRWRALRLWARMVLALLAIALLIGGWFFLWIFFDPWPARATLKTQGDTWPLAFSPDGLTFLTSGQGGINRWDVANGRKEGETWVMQDGQPAIIGEFSPDGRTFAAVAFLRPKMLAIHLIDVTTGRNRASLSIKSSSIYALRFADGGRTLKTFLGDAPDLKEVVTWDSETGLEISSRAITAPTKGGITAISADVRILAIGRSGKSTVELWDLNADRSLGLVMNSRSTSSVCWGGIGLTGNGRTLAVTREDGTLELWDVPTRTLRTTHTIGLNASGLKFSPDGRTLAADVHRLPPTSFISEVSQAIRQVLGKKRMDDDVVVVDLATGKRLALAPNAIHPHYSPDGQTIATRDRDLSVKLRAVPGPSK